MIQGKATTRWAIGAVLFVVSGCSGATGESGATTASGGTAAGGTTTATSTGGNATNPTSGGSMIAGGNSTTTGGASAGGSSTQATGGAGSGNVTGGATSVGGAATGGKATGGSPTSGTATGGNATGGVSSLGGASLGGKATGGNATGGVSSTGGTSLGGKATGGNATGGTATGGSAGATTIVLPTANASFDYQIGGAYTPPTGVRAVSRDRNSPVALGLYNICYVNGFQIQPDEESFWTAQHPSLILRNASGNPVVDADWGEMLLDTSTAAKRTELATVVGSWMAQCKTDGFHAVEIDNLDSYSRSNGLLTQANNVAFMALLSSTAHSHGLAIAQKNSSELLGSVAAMGTDFAVVEECNRYTECGAFQAAYGNLVFIVEYRSQDFQAGCSAYPELSIVLRDLNVTTPSSSSYVYQGC